MKVSVFTVVACFVVVAQAELTDDFKGKVLKKVHEVGAACAEKEGATGEDIAELMEKKPPSRKSGKCLLACFNQGFGAQDADGKLNLEGALKSIEPFKAQDAAIYEKIAAVIKKCHAEIGSEAGDRCEIAVKVAGCTKREMQAVSKKGLKIPKIIELINDVRVFVSETYHY